MKRVTVYLNALEREWTHENEAEWGDRGITLTWSGTQARSFIPWANVLRVDTDLCRCPECRAVAE